MRLTAARAFWFQNKEEDLPECGPWAVCSKVDLYDSPWVEKQCRCPTSSCSASLDASDGHTVTDKTRLFKVRSNWIGNGRWEILNVIYFAALRANKKTAQVPLLQRLHVDVAHVAGQRHRASDALPLSQVVRGVSREETNVSNAAGPGIPIFFCVLTTKCKLEFTFF